MDEDGWFECEVENASNVRTTLLKGETATHILTAQNTSSARRKMWGEDGNGARLLS
jgi:hypothetical protein